MARLFRKRAAAITVDGNRSPQERWDAALHHACRTRETWLVHLNAFCEADAIEGKSPALDELRAGLDATSCDWSIRDADATDALLDLPAPTIADALVKLEIAVRNDRKVFDAIDDLRRLAGIPQPDLVVLEDI